MSPDTTDLKAWITLRARACRVGVVAYRTDPLDGPRAYFTVRYGVPRQHIDLASLEAYVSEIAA
jgi:hypothetical protein